MLFYVLTILAIITRHADLVFVVLAWVFVLIAHAAAYVHSPATMRPHARHAVTASARSCWSVMWLIFMVRIVLGLP